VSAPTAPRTSGVAQPSWLVLAAVAAVAAVLALLVGWSRAPEPAPAMAAAAPELAPAGASLHSLHGTLSSLPVRRALKYAVPLVASVAVEQLGVALWPHAMRLIGPVAASAARAVAAAPVWLARAVGFRRDRVAAGAAGRAAMEARRAAAAKAVVAKATSSTSASRTGRLQRAILTGAAAIVARLATAASSSPTPAALAMVPSLLIEWVTAGGTKRTVQLRVPFGGVILDTLSSVARRVKIR
jgi:hypothetical protein